MPPAQGAYTCPYCRMASDGGGGTCPHCGAPVDVRLQASPTPAGSSSRRSGTWPASGSATPPARSAARTCRWPKWRCTTTTGSTSPTTCCCTPTPSVRLGNMPMKGGWKRMRAGMPLIMMTAQGPGHIAFSADEPGETLAVPLAPGQRHRRGRAPLPRRHRQRQLRLAERQRLVHHPGRRRRGVALPAGPDHGHASTRPAATACCCCTPRATRSSVTWPRASASWCSRAG